MKKKINIYLLQRLAPFYYSKLKKEEKALTNDVGI